MGSHHLRGQRYDLQIFLIAQLSGDRAKDPGPLRLAVVVDEAGRVVVESDIGAVRPTPVVDRAHDHRPDLVSLLDRAVGRGVAHAGDDRAHIARDIGILDYPTPLLVVSVLTAFASSTATATLTIQLQAAPNYAGNAGVWQHWKDSSGDSGGGSRSRNRF